MPEFWPHCGYRLLNGSDERGLGVTDEYLRSYFARPELELVPESCDTERALRARMLEAPRSAISADELAAMADVDARENYRVMLRFRERLLAADSLEGFYFDLFRSDLAIPPAFVHHTAQVILRHILRDVENGLILRAAELFWRPQSVSFEKGRVLLADQETVQEQVSHAGFGNVGRLLRELQAPLRSVDLDVLDESNHPEYFGRDERFDLVLAVNPGTPGSRALAEVLARWIGHFHGVAVTVEPVREIPDEDWSWHVGLDAEATAILNDTYNGSDVDPDRMKRIVGLFRVDFSDPDSLRAEMRGRPVFLGLASTPDHTLRMKPQNLLMNLPLVRRA